MYSHHLRYLLLFAAFSITTAEYFTSTTHLKDLLRTEIELSVKLKHYVESRYQMLDKIKKFYTSNEDTGKYITDGNATSYAGDPLYTYSCIKRWVKEWPVVKGLANEKHGLITTLQNEKDNFPGDVDLDGAKAAILRLQQTFALPSTKIINGFTDDEKISPKLSIEDAFQIGWNAYVTRNAELSISWMREVLRLINSGNGSSFADHKILFQVLDVLSWAEYQKNNIKESLECTSQLLKIAPNDTRISKNHQFLVEKIKNLSTVDLPQDEKRAEKETYKTFYYIDEEDDNYRYHSEIARTSALCRGETKPVPKKYEKYLRCWFKTNHPRLILKPAKIERLYPKPEIIMFRDAIREPQMEYIKQLSNPLLSRATVNNPLTGKLEVASYRVSKSAWLGAYEDPDLLKKIDDQIEAYTGLDMKTAESIQVANYGMGGHYEPHFDFARTVPLRPPPWKKRDNYTIRPIYGSQDPDNEIGERIATMLFYISDVESGGATVFTNIGQAVKPSKGDAVFWYNLNHDGSGDFETRHSACPVLFGEKWVSNRWIHEYGQEFRRKCKLRIEDDWW